MKTISELNRKWWYRLLKVFYLLFMVIPLIGIPVAIYYSYAPYFDNQNSYIKCANEKEFKLQANGLYLYSSYMDSWDQDKAKKLCFDFVPDEIDATTGFRRLSITEKSGRYELVSKYTEQDWFATFGYSLLSIIGVLIFFEIIRRIFYYVVLGSIRPKKAP